MIQPFTLREHLFRGFRTMRAKTGNHLISRSQRARRYSFEKKMVDGKGEMHDGISPGSTRKRKLNACVRERTIKITIPRGKAERLSLSLSLSLFL